MTRTRSGHRTPAGRGWIALLGLVLLAGCGASQPAAFELAASKAADDLVAQTQQLPTFIARLEAAFIAPPPGAPKLGVVIDPMLDTASRQQTVSTTLLEQRATRRISAKFPQFEFLPFDAPSLGRARYLLTGTMTRLREQRENKVVRLDLALTELKSGNVVAQASALARDDNLDSTPLRYYRDSPVLMKDKVMDGYTRTTSSPPGTPADTYYLQRIAAATVIHVATSLYNAERYQEALEQYRNVLSTPEGEQLRTLTGVYLTSAKLGKAGDAEKAFAKVVALGFAYQELGVKFLFNPGTTDFWSDAKISGAYGMWLRQIARESVSAHACLDIVGHSSSSGLAATNDALSLRRAGYVRQRLIGEAANLAGRTRAVGMGAQQNIVGSGSDDAFDVLDRRVEFKIVPCG